MLKVKKFGFTLIELLVVIAIIAMLASIILASLGTARNKAKIASAQESMQSMRAQAELYVDANGTYPLSICGNLGASPGVGSPLYNLYQSVLSQGFTSIPGVGDMCLCSDGSALIVNCTVGSRPKTWAYRAYLGFGTVNSADYFCVDSSGAAKQGVDIGVTTFLCS